MFITKGTIAGSLNKDGYWRVTLQDKVQTAHRVVWVLLRGEIPEDQTIDHIDMNPSNNRIENLRLVSHAVNCRNRTQYSNNQTGHTGVSYFEPRNGSSPRYTASWRGLDGLLKSKSYSLSVYGDNALTLAIEYRKKMIEELNTLGANYSEQHGEIKNDE